MTQDTRAQGSRPSRKPAPSRLEQRGRVSLVTGLLLGGGVVGCVAAGFALSSPSSSQAMLAPSLPERAERSHAPRVVAAPDPWRFAEAGPAAAPRAEAGGRRPGVEAATSPHPTFSRLDRISAAATRPKPVAPTSHRFDSAQASRWATFVPVAVPVPAAASLVAEASVAAVREEASSAAHAGKARVETSKAAPVDVASLEESHVETALPDLPAEALDAPQNARDALERELLAVPMPTARPFRQAVSQAPNLRQRSRAPAGLLAYARPDVGGLGDEPALVPQRVIPASPALGAGTAVYDISASTVYLPNGERLEAHSGLGSLRDDVRYVHVKNRGATPPHTYNLTMRESLFHGVAAIRLTPIGGEGRIHNRNGLLAHTYMLGPRGDSNGCVSFKDYKRFLAAFKRGEIRRLVVVPSYKAASSSRLASLFGLGKR